MPGRLDRSQFLKLSLSHVRDLSANDISLLRARGLKQARYRYR